MRYTFQPMNFEKRLEFVTAFFPFDFTFFHPKGNETFSNLNSVIYTFNGFIGSFKDRKRRREKFQVIRLTRPQRILLVLVFVHQKTRNQQSKWKSFDFLGLTGKNRDGRRKEKRRRKKEQTHPKALCLISCRVTL